MPSPTSWCSSYWKAALGLPSTTVANFTYYIYIYIYIDRLFRCNHDSLVQLDTRGASSRGRCPPNFMLGRWYIPNQVCESTSAPGFSAHVSTFVCLHFTLLAFEILNLLEDLYITQVATINTFAKVLEPPLLSPNVWKYIYCHPHTDCFIVSQLFRVARYARRFKLGSKSAKRYVRPMTYP